jgi:hypothetical protein
MTEAPDDLAAIALVVSCVIALQLTETIAPKTC